MSRSKPVQHYGRRGHVNSWVAGRAPWDLGTASYLPAVLRELTPNMSVTEEEEWRKLFAEVGARGQVLAAHLAGRVEAAQNALEELRQSLASTSLPSDADVKRLGRY